jgi:transcriptional regulator with XRE-family HTH domain
MNKKLGEIIKKAREKKGWSQNKLAEETKRLFPPHGVSQSTINRIEDPAYQENPTESTKIKLLKTLGIYEYNKINLEAKEPAASYCEFDLSDQEKSLIEAFRKLPRRSKRSLYLFIMNKLDEISQEKSISTDKSTRETIDRAIENLGKMIGGA